MDSLKTALNSTSDPEIKLSTLDALTRALVRANDPQQEVFLKQYLQQASALKEYDLLASKSRFLIQYYLNQRFTDKAELLADSLLNLQDYFKEPSSLGHLKLKRAAAYYDKNLFSKAIADYQKSADHFMTSGDSIFAADAFFFGGQALSDVNDFLQAIQTMNALNNFMISWGINNMPYSLVQN